MGLFARLAVLSFLVLVVFRFATGTPNDLVRLQAPNDADMTLLSAPKTHDQYKFAGEYRQIYDYTPSTSELVSGRRKLVFAQNSFSVTETIGRLEINQGKPYSYQMEPGYIVITTPGRKWVLNTDGKFLQCTETGIIFAPAQDYAKR